MRLLKTPEFLLMLLILGLLGAVVFISRNVEEPIIIELENVDVRPLEE